MSTASTSRPGLGQEYAVPALAISQAQRALPGLQTMGLLREEAVRLAAKEITIGLGEALIPDLAGLVVIRHVY
jgi:hypothetical protein